MDLKIPNIISVVRRSVTFGNAVHVHGAELDGDNQKIKRYTDRRDRFKKNCGGDFLDVIDIENKPTKGYRLFTHQNTYKVEFVQLLSPLGFVTNISIANLFDLISSSTINNSLIEDELFYDDKMNLISTNSIGYKNLISSAKKVSETKKAAECVEVGDILVTRPASGAASSNPASSAIKYLYCGKYHVLSSKNNFPLSIKPASELLHVMKDIDSGRFIVARDLKTGTYDVSPAGRKVVREDIIAECNEQIKDIHNNFCDSYNFNHSYNTPILFGDKKFKKEQTEYIFEEVDKDTALEGSIRYGRTYKYNLNGIDRFVIVSDNDWKSTKVPLYLGKQNDGYRSYSYGSKYNFDNSSDHATLLLSVDCRLNEDNHISTNDDEHETYRGSWRDSYDFSRTNKIGNWPLAPYSPKEGTDYVHLLEMDSLKYKIGFLKLKDKK